MLINIFNSFGRDGRRPHVKSNIRAKLANGGSGSRKKFFSKLNQQKIRKKAGRKVERFPFYGLGVSEEPEHHRDHDQNFTQVSLSNRGRKEIKFVAPAEEESTTQAFSGPEVSRMLLAMLYRS